MYHFQARNSIPIEIWVLEKEFVNSDGTCKERFHVSERIQFETVCKFFMKKHII